MPKQAPETVYLVYQVITAALFRLVFTVNMVYFVTVAGLDPLQLVLVGTALETAVFLFEVPTGIVADTISRRLSVIIGVFLIGAGFLVEGLFPAFWPIIAAQLVWGIGYTFTSGALQAWISDEIGEQRAPAVYLRGVRYSQVGALVATGISVALAQMALNIPIVIGGALFGLLGLYLIGFMTERGFEPASRREYNAFQNMAHILRSGLGMLRLRPALVGILLIGLFFGLYSEGYDRLWTAHLLERFTFPQLGSLEVVTWFGLMAAAGQVLTWLATGWVEGRFDLNRMAGLVRILAVLSALLVVCLALFALAGNLWLAVGLVLAIGVVREVISPLYTAWVNHRLDSRVRATVLSLSGQVDAIGQIAGGPLLGLVARQGSIQAGLLGSALLLAPVLALFGWQMKNHDEPPGLTPENIQQ